jgi:hypothetical protein
MDKLVAQELLNRVRQRLMRDADPTSPIDTNDENWSPHRDRSRLVIEGPINQYMFREGQALAVEIVRSVGLKDSPALIARLVATAKDRPGSYAAGIKHVIDSISHHVSTVEGIHSSSSQ